MSRVSSQIPFGLALGLPEVKKFMGKEIVHRCPRTSLIAAKRGNQLLAPVLFEGSTNSLWFNQWLEQHLLRELSESSTLILNNTRFHKKHDVEAIAARAGHQVLFLPPYSPDFNNIEQDFAIINKRRAYAPSGTTIDQIIQVYGN